MKATLLVGAALVAGDRVRICRRSRTRHAIQSASGAATVRMDWLLWRRTRRRRLGQQGDHRSGAAGAGLVSGAPVTTGVTAANVSPTG